MRRPCAARPQPQQRRDAREGAVVADGDRRFVGQGEELGVLLEAVGHRELVGELVVALDRLAVRRLAGDRGLHARLGDVVADAPAAPTRHRRGAALARAELACSSAATSLLVTRDALAPATVLPVEAHHGVGSRAGAGEEVED